MSASASLETTSVTVEPGAGADVSLQVRNPGTTVESYRFEVVGASAAWATVEPETLSLYPGASATATVRFNPPRSSEVAAGELPFGVRVIPTARPDEAVVPEGVVTVLPFESVTAELVPRSTHGKFRGRHQVAVDNRGNAPIEVRLTAQVGTERVRLRFTPEQLPVASGRAEFARLDVRPVKLRWRGAPATHPFQVVITTPSEDQVVLDGTYEQEPLLAGWVPRAVIVGVLGVAALAGLWYGVLRPAVRSAAREVVTPEVNRAIQAGEIRPAELGNPGGGQGQGPNTGDGGNTGTGNGTGTGTGTGSGTGNGTGNGTGSSSNRGGTAPQADPVPTSARLEVRDAVGGSSTTSSGYRVPNGQVFELTDFVVQNPQGDAGTLVITSQGRVLFTFALENFRDLDHHFSTPIVVPGGGRITMTVTCRQVGTPVGAPAPSQCSESLFLGGVLRPAPTPTPTPTP